MKGKAKSRRGGKRGSHAANRTVCPGWQQARWWRVNEVSSDNLWRARRGGVGRRCKYRRGSDTFTVRLALIRTLGQTFGDAHGETFGEAFGRNRIQGWPVGVFALEGTLIRAFTFMIRTTTGTLTRRSCRSNRFSVVGKMGHISSVAT